MISQPGTDRQLTLTRVLDAPRALVFKAWTDPQHVRQWWGPDGFTNPVCEIDPRPGGAILIHMHGYGTTHPMQGTYEVVEEPTKLVFRNGALNEAGDMYFEIRNTITFEELGSKTKLTMHAQVLSAGPGSEQPLSGMEEGWEQTLNRLEAHVSNYRNPAYEQKITTFLWFNANAEKAAEFYCSIFKNSRILDISHYGETGPGDAGSVMGVSFQLEGQKFYALNGGPEFTFSPAISLFVDCRDQAEVDELWHKLLAGGGQPSQCGWLTDKFGLSWQIVPTALMEMLRGGSKNSQSAMKAMLQMSKLDVAALQRAFEDA